MESLEDSVQDVEADLDGDGQTDVVIVDKETGAFRVGYQTTVGAPLWSDARASDLIVFDACANGVPDSRIGARKSCRHQSDRRGVFHFSVCETTGTVEQDRRRYEYA